MRPLFVTQSASLNVFEALRRELASRVPVERAGFVLCDSWHYLNWVAGHPNFERSGHVLLKDWEVTARRNELVDMDALRKTEERLGAPGLFAAVLADRRWHMGPDSTYTQDYRRRFSDQELYSMLQAAVAEMERLFDTLKPDVIFGFICVTALDCLAYLVARSRGIRYLNLRASRIGNNVFFGSTINDPTPEFVAAYRRCLSGGSPRLANARAYIARMRAEITRYEGVVAPSARPMLRMRMPANPLARVMRLWREHRAYKFSIAATDNHVPGILRPLLFHVLLNPLRARRVDRALRSSYVRPKDMANRRYAFFPLHTEPEVSLLVYGRPFVNQIEVLRAIAWSLPADMTLVVKEHPGMVGKRTIAAYRKILDIPRIRLAPPETESRDWLQGASLVTVIVGSIGLEAAMHKCPVVTLGHIPFNILPDGMVRRVTDMTALADTLRRALDEHRHDEAALESFVAATMETSVGVNLYSTLLGRQGAFAETANQFSDDIARLADHVLRRLDESPAVHTDEAAAW